MFFSEHLCSMIGAAAKRSAAVGMYWGTGVSGFIFIRERRQIAVIQQKRNRWKKPRYISDLYYRRATVWYTQLIRRDSLGKIENNREEIETLYSKICFVKKCLPLLTILNMIHPITKKVTRLSQVLIFFDPLLWSLAPLSFSLVLLLSSSVFSSESKNPGLGSPG